MSKIFEELIKKRGISEKYLKPKYLPDGKVYRFLPDIEKAVERIARAVSENEKILVYGDYDVDGVTATAVMVQALKLAGVSKPIETMLPDRFVDGYGMSERSIEVAKRCKATLVITVDCGSNNSAVIDEFNEAGIDVVVTDHHEISGELPNAVAVVNPKVRNGGEYDPDVVRTGLIDLAGVGVAYMVTLGLRDKGLIRNEQEKWLLDLVLIGTICDSMTMSQVNRELCYYGKIVLEKTKREGLLALIKVGRMNDGVSGYMVGFQIGPRLNAAGRMRGAELALSLLMTKEKTEAAKLAKELNAINMERKAAQQQAISEIENGQVEVREEDSVIVVAGKWHEGVIGIVAGKLEEKYRKPTFVLTEVAKEERADVILKGSGRSFGDFSLAKALEACRGEIVSGGGHVAACGLKVRKEKVEDFRKTVNEYYKSLNLKDQERFLNTEAEMKVDDFSEITVELVDELAQLEPCSEGNRLPKFELTGVAGSVTRMGKEQNCIKINILDEKRNQIELVGFYVDEKWFEIRPMDKVRVVIDLEKHLFNGNTSVQGIIREIERI